MKKTILSIFSGVVLLCSCSEQYLVNGSSSVQDLEGKMLYLKVFQDDDMKTIDSTKVIHGRFKFGGGLDSVMMANLFLGDQSLMPVVLETGEVVMTLSEMGQSATGTPLNDSLNAFITRKVQLDAQLAELPRKESQLIMDGMDHDEIMRMLNVQYQQLAVQNDQLVTRFITSNYNNVLGPGIFMILTSGFQYPILNPQIDEILSQATPYFKNHPYVREYVKAANENMEKIHSGGQ